MRLSHAEYTALLARNPKLRPTEPQSTQGLALVGAIPRKEKGSNRAAGGVKSPRRRRIKFTVYSVRPCDWDGYHIKEIQDLLVHAGILDSDDWDSLEGGCTSEKVHKKEHERTEIEIL